MLLLFSIDLTVTFNNLFSSSYPPSHFITYSASSLFFRYLETNTTFYLTFLLILSPDPAYL